MWSVKFERDRDDASRGNLTATWTGQAGDAGFVFTFARGGTPTAGAINQFANAANNAKNTARTAWLAVKQIETDALTALGA